jgi:hypothetical protein
MPTTIDTITIEQIRTLQADAAKAGDGKRVELCARAARRLLHSDRGHPSVRACVAAIRDARTEMSNPPIAHLDFNCTRITVFRRRSGGTDLITFDVVGSTPFPELDADQPGAYQPCLSIETRRGYAEQWLRLNGFSPDMVEVIEV